MTPTPLEQRAQHLREGGLAEPPERQRRERDAELARREVGGELLRDGLQEARAAAALLDELLQARGADLDEGELGGDEEAVGEDDHHRQQQREGRAHGRPESHRAARGDTASSLPASPARTRGRGTRAKSRPRTIQHSREAVVMSGCMSNSLTNGRLCRDVRAARPPCAAPAGRRRGAGVALVRHGEPAGRASCRRRSRTSAATCAS